MHNPFREIRLRARLSQAQFAATLRVPLRNVLAAEYMHYPEPPPDVVRALDVYLYDAEELVRDYKAARQHMAELGVQRMTGKAT